MSRYVDRIVTTIHEAEEALSEDVRDQQKRWRYDLHRGRVWFDKEVRHAHKQLKQGIPSFLRHGSVLNLLTTPIIYSLVCLSCSSTSGSACISGSAFRSTASIAWRAGGTS